MRKVLVCIWFLFMGWNLMAQVDEQIAALVDSVKVKIEQYGVKSEQVVVACFDLTMILNKKAKYNEAHKIAKRCLEICLEIFGEKHALTATSYSLMGTAHLHTRDYSKALRFGRKGLEIKLEVLGEKHASTAISYRNIGLVYNKTADYFKAIKYHRKALNIFREVFGEKHTLTGKSYDLLAKAHFDIGDYSKAIEYLQKTLNIYLEILEEKHTLTAAAYNHLGLAYGESGDYPQATKYTQKALNIYLEVFGENHALTANAFNHFGLVYLYTGDYSKSLEFSQKALTIRLEVFGENHALTAVSYYCLGLIFEKKGDYSKSLEFSQKALAIRLEIFGENHPISASSYHTVGIIYDQIGDNDKASIFYQKALTIYLETIGEKHAFTASSYSALGVRYGKTRDYFKALEYFQKALEIRLEVLGEKHSSTAISYNNIGLAYTKIKNYNQGIKYHQKALEIRLEILGDRHTLTAVSFHNIGSVYLVTKDYHKSIEYHQKALKIYLEVFGNKHPDLIRTQVHLACSYEYLEQYNYADSLWNIIIPNLEDQLNNNYIFLPDDKKLLYLNTVAFNFKRFYHFMSRYGNEQTKLLASNLLINTKSLILDYAISTRQLIENINDENIDSIAFQLNMINQKVAKAELLSKEELKQKGWSLDSLRLLQDDIASQILKHPELKSKLNPTKVSWQQIQSKLQDDEALVDYFTFYDWVDSVWVYEAMLIKKDASQPVFILISPKKPVFELLKAEDNFPYLPLYIQHQEARQEMYGHVWKALEPHLKDIKTIHLTPVASLNKIDFESLENYNGQYLADLYDFHYYSSSKDFYKQKKSQPNYVDATLYGHIAYYKDDEQQYEAEEDSFDLRLQRQRLPALHATLPEVKTIEKICSKNGIESTLLTNQAATEDTIEYYSGNYATDIKHFATHGAFLLPLNKKMDSIEMASLTGQDLFRAADNPLQRSMLMLSNAGEAWQKSDPNIISENDGILTALEVTNLDLSKTELVVLSACNSGIGSQHTTEGVFGLPRAFKLAGADKILASLWSVHDEITKELMILFYTNLLEKKQPAATALRNAKAEMRNRNEIPKYWAGFILIE